MVRLTEAIECFKNRETESPEAVRAAKDYIVMSYCEITKKCYHRAFHTFAGCMVFIVIFLVASKLLGKIWLDAHELELAICFVLIFLGLSIGALKSNTTKSERLVGEILVDLDDIRLLPGIMYRLRAPDNGMKVGKRSHEVLEYDHNLRYAMTHYLKQVQPEHAALLSPWHRNELRKRIKFAATTFGVYDISDSKDDTEDRIVTSIEALARIGDVESLKSVERYLTIKHKRVLSVHMRLDRSLQFLTDSPRVRIAAEEARRQLGEVVDPSAMLLRGSSLPETPTVLLRPAMGAKDSYQDQETTLLRSVEEPSRNL